ncbi:MAG TPA: TIGR04076 family protein [Candidatus Bathyarchaeota archaeon]|nr:TIGR04076 family protein [Candidatus Bathyarchaeota archaeon]
MNRKYRLIITVKEIQGRCPVFKLGDKITVESPKIIPEETDAVCIHALGSMLTMLVALSRGISFKTLGLAREEGNEGYVQCLDPGSPYTDGGTVLFEIKRVPIDSPER